MQTAPGPTPYKRCTFAHRPLSCHALFLVRGLSFRSQVDRLVEETLKKHQSMLVPEYSHSGRVLDRAVLSRDSSDRPRATAVSASAKLAVSNEAGWGAPRCSSADGRAATAVSAEPTRWAMRPVVNIEGIYAEFDVRLLWHSHAHHTHFLAVEGNPR